MIRIFFILCSAGILLFSCKTQMEAVATQPEKESIWTPYEKNTFLESCLRDAREIEGLNPEHYCNCFLEKLQYDYTIDQVLNLTEDVIFNMAEACIESQPQR